MKKMRINFNYLLGFLGVLIVQSQIYATENNNILLNESINQQKDNKNVLEIQKINSDVIGNTNKLKTKKKIIKSPNIAPQVIYPQYDDYCLFVGDVIFDNGCKCKYPNCSFNNYNMTCAKESTIKIGKWNNLNFANSNIEINTDNIECIGHVNVNLCNTKLIINNNYENHINLLYEGTNRINLKNSELIFNNIEGNNVINLFNNDDALPIINLTNSSITFNNVDLKLNNGKINLCEKSNFTCNNSKITFGTKGIFNINNSNCKFNNSLVNLNSGKIKLDGNNSKFELLDSKIISEYRKCIFEVLPGNKIFMNNSLVNCLGKFKKIEVENLVVTDESVQDNEMQQTPIIDLKNNSIFSWRKMRCNQEDLNSIDETSAVILQEYFN